MAALDLAAPGDRRRVVSGPVGGSGALGRILVEVVAVDAADRETDLGGELVGLGAEQGARVRLAWQAGLYLDANMESFIDGRAYILTAPDGTDYTNCRMERFERLGPPLVGLNWHRQYRITYRQLVR